MNHAIQAFPLAKAGERTLGAATDTRFRHLTAEDWRAIFDRGEFLTFEHDDVILLEGVENRSVYFVEEGAVRIERNDHGVQVELARLCVGAVFGEMSVLENARASATVVADGVVDVIRIDRAELEFLMLQDTGLGMRLYRSLAECLSNRLRTTSGNVH